jgi:hypothetical protein
MRTVTLRTGAKGFGFTLGGERPCRLSTVHPGGVAAQAGLQVLVHLHHSFQLDYLVPLVFANKTRMIHKTPKPMFIYCSRAFLTRKCELVNKNNDRTGAYFIERDLFRCALLYFLNYRVCGMGFVFCDQLTIVICEFRNVCAGIAGERIFNGIALFSMA